MTWTVLALVLGAAALHAGWNTAVKAAGSPFVATARICIGGIALAAPVLPFLPLPAPAAWPFLAASVLVHLVYFVLTAAAYARVDLSVAYPIMRGGGIMVTALAAPFLFSDHLPPFGLAGIVLVGLALAALALGTGGRGFGRGGLAVVTANALTIGAYSLLDGLGARASGAPFAYTLWVFSLGAACNLGLMVLRGRIGALRALLNARDFGLAVLGGASAMGSYGLVLTAMTLAPVALVAALRETSMLFATGLALFLLHEKVGARRVAAACLVAAGAVLIKLA
ncbi:DMT family transporter [Zavarzinia compransoris]|uniref:SMR family transporter n=1 Tax=Zavarzinia marina TaxID=2911065 RepID=UPI001F217C3F|nr:SMR family transporter [Zavarzinia marina]MCF4165404.1 DMT family transporter [Zavarzinia marina]